MALTSKGKPDSTRVEAVRLNISVTCWVTVDPIGSPKTSLPQNAVWLVGFTGRRSGNSSDGLSWSGLTPCFKNYLNKSAPSSGLPAEVREALLPLVRLAEEVNHHLSASGTTHAHVEVRPDYQTRSIMFGARLFSPLVKTVVRPAGLDSGASSEKSVNPQLVGLQCFSS